MIQLEYGPLWFYIPSIVIDAISFLVVLAIALVGLKYYKIDKDRKSYLHLSLAFFLIAAAIMFKILNNIPVYYSNFSEQDFGVVNEIVETVRELNIFADVSLSLFVLLDLLGLYFLYNLYEPNKNKRMSFLIIYFILLLSYFSLSIYYLFHFTSLILLVLITSMFIQKCSVRANKNTKLLAYGFGVLAVSSVLYMFILVNPMIYVMAELVQLAGYSLLLLALMGILKYGKKKNKN